MKEQWIRQETAYQNGEVVNVERLEEVVPAVVLQAGDANLYLLMPLDGPPVFWAFEAHLSPLSPAESQGMELSTISRSQGLILTHF